MKLLRLLPSLLIFVLSSYLLADALPTQLITVKSSEHSIQVVYQQDDWQIVDGNIEVASLGQGQDGLPTHSILLGVPTDEIEMQIVSAESTYIQLPQLITKTELVTLSTNMQRRDQSMAQLTFNPVQADGDAVRVFSRIVVELTWGNVGALPSKPNHPAYEELLAETLVNYASLDRPAPQTARVPQIQQRNAPTSTLRIVVTETGLQHLPFATLAAAGLPTEDVSQLRLTQRSQPVATIVHNDGLLFFGEAYEDLYTTENVYWLAIGARVEMATIDESHPSATAATQFTQTLHLEEDTLYWNTMPNGEGQDHWFWGERISPNSTGLDSSRNFTVSLPTVSPSPTVTLRVQLKGHTTLEHKTRISLNGNVVDEQLWAGQTLFTHTIPVTGSLLVAGENVVTVESADAGAVVDQLYINWIELDYAASYAALDNQLTFAPPANGTYAFTITGFTSDSLHLLDVTNPRRPIQVIHIVNDGAIHFQQTVTAGTRFFAASTTTVPQISADEVSNWRDVGNSADWLIITHSDFITPAQRLADHRMTQGMQTAVVDIQDVYDEFGDGFFNPDAIRNFLAYTYDNWQAPAPTYVVLLGDGSQDYKDQLGSGSRNFIPPKMIETYDYGQIPSDHWYVTFAGDDIFEEMFVGRLSAETFPQANAIVDNIIAYETRPAPADQLALFVTDDRESVFEYNSELLIDRLPDLFDVERIYAETYTTATVTRDITQTLLSGATFVNYMGHGNYYRWGSYVAEGRGHRIFTESDADTLANSGLNPFVTVADCLNGFFSIPSNLIIDPYDEALAEAFQRQPNGGAVAVWTDAGFGYTSEQRILMNALYDAIFTNQITSLGLSTNVAKTELYNASPFWEQNVRTMILFGDPATNLLIDETIPTVVSLGNSTINVRSFHLATYWFVLCLLIYSQRILTRRLQNGS